MGDYLRYAMYDKYFKKPGCTSPTCAAGTGKDSAHVPAELVLRVGRRASTASGAGGSAPATTTSGYQNPLAAWALSNVVRADAEVLDSEDRLGDEPQAPDRVLHLVAVR